MPAVVALLPKAAPRAALLARRRAQLARRPRPRFLDVEKEDGQSQRRIPRAEHGNDERLTVVIKITRCANLITARVDDDDDFDDEDDDDVCL